MKKLATATLAATAAICTGLTGCASAPEPVEVTKTVEVTKQVTPNACFEALDTNSKIDTILMEIVTEIVPEANQSILARNPAGIDRAVAQVRERSAQLEPLRTEQYTQQMACRNARLAT